MFENNLWQMEPVGRRENTIQGEKYRFLLLTPCLIRMEYREDGCFEDRPTQVVWNRQFERVDYRLVQKGEGFELFTERLHVTYTGGEFSKNSLNARAIGGQNPYGAVWYYGEKTDNLGGTARTLDDVDGACELEEGIISRSGCAVLDDSKTLILDENGWVLPRKGEGADIYLFAYGNDYKEALGDFYRLTGKTPMLPRFALGNWWSRYYAYTEESYKALITRFEKEKIPFSVGVVDMDWHLVDEVDPKYGSSWTGYTWNKKYFPEPERFLAWLHEHGMKVSLNLHPASGIRAYEDCYLSIAEELGNIDTDKEEPVDFDIASRKFLEAYFKCVLHPEEEKGVDFWWIDWQQGNTTKIPGLDPLWMLNHYHYLDNARDGKRPMTFSRYACPGSHRYPVGFSGDTHVTWDSLDFQPYFTSTASNIGYGWWSHDIGGHMRGCKNNELALRWLQFGVFSPINRIHSSKSEFMGKEPWNYPVEISMIMGKFLRLRHRMIPYLYTMNHRAWAENLPLILPMYYENPMEGKAYEVKNQYIFGRDFLVAPITEENLPGLNRGKVHVWLPEGTYIDFFTGMIYSGGKELDMYRDIHSIPVLVKAGAIVPFTEEIQGEKFLKNPDSLCIRVYAGAGGSFVLYEDDNETNAYLTGDSVATKMEFCWKNGSFTVFPAEGNRALIPEKRSYTVKFFGVEDCEITTDIDGAVKTYREEDGCLTVRLPDISVTEKIQITLSVPKLRKNEENKRIFELLNQGEIPFSVKEEVYSVIQKNISKAAKLTQLCSMKMERELIGAIAEILTAKE